MFRVFSKFNALFVRPKVCLVNWAIVAPCLSLKQIRGAIQEYQTQLIDSVNRPAAAEHGSAPAAASPAAKPDPRTAAGADAGAGAGEEDDDGHVIDAGDYIPLPKAGRRDDAE